MDKIRLNAAGIDIGSQYLYVYVEKQPVVKFESFTDGIEALRDYLLIHKTETVAMEATGVYWVILYEILEEAGLDVWLVDGRETKQVPGRKTDVKDCQWIQQLHSHGLLNRCYVATPDTKELRSYLRLREDHIRSAAMHINHMQKALTEMNIRLKEVLSQIHGSSGMAIIKAILGGERDREKLTALCHTNVLKTKRELVLKSLKGKYTKAGLFALRQAHDAYFFYQEQIKQCDQQLDKIVNRMGDSGNGVKKKKRKSIRHNKPEINKFGQNMINIFEGKDATTISGITDYSWLQLTSEVGVDLSRWPTEKHFTSWLGLAPGQNNSGKYKKRAKKKGRPAAGQIFRLIAQGLINSKNIAIGAYGRRLRARKGSAIAIKAMSRKLAEVYWRVMVKGSEYAEYGVKMYEEQIKLQKLKTMNKLAVELKLKITDNHIVT
jgi:transposase